MRYLLLCILYIGLCKISSIAQSDITKHLIIGTETGGAIATIIDPNTGEKFRSSTLRFGPQIGVFLHPRFVLGGFGLYERHQSNFEPDRPIQFGVGTYLRYYLPIFKKEPWKDYLLPFAELAYSCLNYTPAAAGEWNTSDNMDFGALFFMAGMNFRVFKQLHIECSLRPRIFLPNGVYRWSIRLGVEYHIATTTDNQS